VPVVVARYCNTIIRCKSHEWVTCCQNQSFYYHFIKYFLFHFQANILNIISYNLDLKVKTNCFETVTASLTRFGFLYYFLRKKKLISLPLSPRFEPQRARLSFSRCLTCLLSLQGVQWIRKLVVVRVNWSGHPGLKRKLVTILNKAGDVSNMDIKKKNLL